MRAGSVIIGLAAIGGVGALSYVMLKGLEAPLPAALEPASSKPAAQSAIEEYVVRGEYKGFTWIAVKFPQGPGSSCDRFALRNGGFYSKFNEADKAGDSFFRNGGAKCRQRHQDDVDKALRIFGGDLARLRRNLEN